MLSQSVNIQLNVVSSSKITMVQTCILFIHVIFTMHSQFNINFICILGPTFLASIVNEIEELVKEYDSPSYEYDGCEDNDHQAFASVFYLLFQMKPCVLPLFQGTLHGLCQGHWQGREQVRIRILKIAIQE